MTSPPHLRGYHYVRAIGSGGSSRVYLYEQSVTERLVAIKVDGHELVDAAAQQRFHTEASAMARLAAHPGILTIYDAGITPDSHGYLVLEYAANGSFAHQARTRAVSPEEILSIAVTLCGALQTAHSKGILHRDIKPGNILVSDSGAPLLADFGIATSVYSSTSVPGYSVAWAPPEILRDDGRHTRGEASDVYSLAASLIGILTGSSPYELAYAPRNRTQLTEYIRTRRLPSFSHMGLPLFLEPALRTALEANPQDRYYSALDFARELQRTQQKTSGRQTSLVVHEVPPYLETALPATTPPLAPPAPLPASATHPLPRVARVLAALLLILVVSVSGLLFVSLRTRSHASPNSTSLGSSGSPSTASPETSSVASPVAAPTDAAGRLVGTTATFTWKDPGAIGNNATGDNTYFWQRTDAPGAGTSVPHAPLSAHTSNTTVTIPDVTESQICLRISIVTPDHRMSTTPATACAIRGETP